MWRMWFFFLSLVAGCRASSASELRTRVKWDINYRAVDAVMVDVPQPTNSINWSPPPAVPPPPPPGGNSPGPPPPPGVHPSNPPPPPVGTTPLLVISAASISRPPLPPATTLAAATTSSAWIISITALPPLDPTAVSTPVVYPKKNPASEKKFKLVYLAPVFVLLGILWGSVTAWFAYGCMTRRPKVREEDTLVGGPRYVPAPREGNDLEGGGTLLRDDMHEEVFSWPDLTEKAEPEKRREDDPFLAPPSPSKSKSKSTRTKSTRSTLTTRSDATYALDTDEDEDVPWESLRHKSIKRGILEEVQKEGTRINALRPATGTLLRKASDMKIGRRTRHGRTDSDVLVDDVDLHPLRSRTQSTDPSVASTSRPSSVRADSTNTVESEYSVAGDKTQWKAGTGFRIVAESPAPPHALPHERTPAPPEEAHPALFGMSWWGSTAHVDRYTPLPNRHSSSGSRSLSHAKGTDERDVPVHHHIHMLPQSPPQITSPLLENRLSFTPMTPARTARTVKTTTPATKKTKIRDDDQGRKLRSPRHPSLPFPANHDINSPRPDMYRGKLVKTASPVKPPPMSAHAPSSSSSSGASYTRDKDGRAVRAHVALKKVEDIVERSWETRTRELGRGLGEEGVGSLSPTGFGRRVG